MKSHAQVAVIDGRVMGCSERPYGILTFTYAEREDKTSVGRYTFFNSSACELLDQSGFSDTRLTADVNCLSMALFDTSLHHASELA